MSIISFVDTKGVIFMKTVWAVLAGILVVAILIFGTTYKEVNTEYLRVHIRANSNLEVDQIIKYQIKDAIVEVLTPHVAECNSFEDVEDMLSQNLNLVDSVANMVLRKNNLNYTAKSKLSSEEFPTRSYNGFVLEEGIYEALIVELGEAKGDNWWCVIYPPLCFTSTTSGSNVIYKSRILDMINNFFK